MFDQYEKIEDYINGNLNSEERATFENAMKGDKELAKVVDEYPVYSNIADEIIDQDLSDQIKKEQAIQKQTNQKLTKARIPKYVYPIAAAIVALIIAYPFLTSTPSGQDLFEEYYSPPMSETVRGEQSEVSSEIKGCDQGHLYLEKKEFTKAQKAFSESLDDVEIRCQDKAHYYSALIAVRNEEYTVAKRYLHIVIGNEISGYETKAQDLINDLHYH